MNILQFALGMNIAQFAGAAKQAEQFLERITHSAKGGGGVLGELSEKMLKVFSSARNVATAGGAGGFMGMAGAFGAALGAVEAIKGVMLGVGEVAREVAENFVHAADHAAHLYYQSMRTQSSIGALYGLGEGAKAVGLSEDAPTGMLLRLQRSLSGVSETGERTEQTFAALGLSMRELRKLAPQEQLNEVFEALHKIDGSARAGYASNLFGRFAYGDVLQIVNQLERWKEAQTDSMMGGALLQLTGAAFGSAHASWEALRADMEIFFLGIARYLVVPFQDVVEILRSFPWDAIAVGIGEALKPMLDLLRFAANFESFMIDPTKWLNNRANEYQQASDDAAAQPDGEKSQAWWANMATLANKWIFGMPGQLAGGAKLGQGNPNDEGPTEFMKPNVNAFEKMGFVFNGGTDAAVNYARRTAIATEKMAMHLAAIQGGPAGFAAELLNAP